jgi:hypothetical protein
MEIISGEITYFREIIGFGYIFGGKEKKGGLSTRHVPVLLSSIHKPNISGRGVHTLHLSLSTLMPLPTSSDFLYFRGSVVILVTLFCTFNNCTNYGGSGVEAVIKYFNGSYGPEHLLQNGTSHFKFISDRVAQLMI